MTWQSDNRPDEIISPLLFSQVLVETGKALLLHWRVTFPPNTALAFCFSTSTTGTTGRQNVNLTGWRISAKMLTLHPEIHSFADGWRDSIAGNTEVGPDVLLADTVQDQGGTAHTAHSHQDVGPVLSPPQDLRLREAPGLAGQVHSLLLPDDQVVGCLAVDDGGRNMNLQVAPPASHGVGVDLTHVPASVLLLHVSNVELPLLVLPVGERHPLVPGDDAVVDGQDGLGVHPHPGNLVGPEVGDVTGEDGLPAGHHGLVLHAVREVRGVALRWQS